MKKMPAGQFKQTCLKVMEEIAHSHEEIIITKRGVPIVRVIPVENYQDPVGFMKGAITIYGDIIESINIRWGESDNE
jgi:prevent-host-death family protein